MDEQTIYRRRWLTLGVLCLSLVMIVVGNTVLNVAIPTLSRELHATSSQLQWMVDSYALIFAGLLLTAGALGDRFGRKGALTLGLIIFGTASGVSALATSPTQIILTRGVMGLGAAFVMPATLSILTNVFPPRERARAIAIWAGFAGAGAAIGPIAGGWLLENFWWGSVFLLNVPIVLLALGAGRVLVPTSRDPQHAALDPMGAGLSIVAVGSLVYGFIEAPDFGWSDRVTVSAFAIAAVFLVLFAWWELRFDHPMLDLRYFRDRRFSSGVLAITFVFFAMFGTFFLMTQYLQIVWGYSPLGAGVRSLPAAFGLMVFAPTGARLVERFGAKRVVAGGLFLVAVGLVMLAQVGVDVNYPYFALCLIVVSAGMGNTAAPSTASIMSAMPLSKAGVGSAVNDTSRELGGALGVAVLGSLATSHYTASLADKIPAGVPARVAAV
ncbi:MAG TPA: MFS transporter, partial [Actinomycetota bacterium]|nr:MFS transporter [Actinomycetota bacterium]